MKQAIILILAATTTAMAQSTPEFNIAHMGGTRKVSYYIPNTYNASAPAGLIVGLHGLGDNSTSYRNVAASRIVNGNPNIGTQGYDNVIFVCPDGGNDANRDYYSPAGDEAIIAAVIADAKQRYAIDDNRIYLQGFSLGGRSALRYGLDHYQDFRGLYLSSPAVQSCYESNNANPPIYFNYDNAKYIPIHIYVGDQDWLHPNVLETADNLKNAEGIVYIGVVAGGGHTLYGSQVEASQKYFNKYSSRKPLDAGIAHIKTSVSGLLCSSTYIPKVNLRNLGTSSLTSAEIWYSLDGTTASMISWNGNLASLEMTSVVLPAINVTTGIHELKVYTSLPNNGTDSNMNNDTASYSFTVDLSARSLPFIEGFESTSFPPSGWLVDNTNKDKTFVRHGTVGGNGNSQASVYMDNFSKSSLYSTSSDFLYTPAIDLTNSSSPELKFDLAFAKRTSSSIDSLIVSISDDCGYTWQRIFAEGASSLQSYSGNASTAFSPKNSEWNSKKVSLNSYAGKSSVTFKFEWWFYSGNNVYLDDIMVYDAATTGLEEMSASNAVKIYPNPATNYVNISSDHNINNLKVEFLDLFGRSIRFYTSELFSDGRFPIEGLIPGIYTVRITGDNYRATKKIVVQ